MKRNLRPLALSLALALALLTCGCHAAEVSSSAPEAAPGNAAQTFSAPEAPAQEPFSLVWFSDIQNYSEDYPEILDSMTEWIAGNAGNLNAKYAICTGDFVNHAGAPGEWKNAVNALDRLDGVLPLFSVAGNHDTPDNVYDTYLSYFGKSYFKTLDTYGGCYDGGRGRYDLLDVGDLRLLLLGIGYDVDDDGIAWLNGILAQYPERAAILCFHGYIGGDGVYTSDGAKLFARVVAPNPNVKLVLCGHRHAVYRSTIASDCNNDGVAEHTVHQLLADYQAENQGGGGYLCLLTFDPTKDELRVASYSPYLDDYSLYDSEPGIESFTLPLELS